MKFKLNLEYEKLNPELSKEEYAALKESIKSDGIRTELHVLSDGTILCGNNRYTIAQELKIPDKDIPFKIVDLKDENQIKIYIIEDNLIRRNLLLEQKADLEYKLYKLHELIPGKRTDLGKNLPKVDVYDDIAKKTGQKRKSVVNHIKFAKLKEKNPKKYGKMKMSKVLADDKKQRKKQEIAEKSKSYVAENNDIQIIHGDFREKCGDIKDNSIDLILTDPPYPEEYLPLWEDLAKVAERVLKPSGFCIAYCGHIHLDKVMGMLSKHLNLYWVCSLVQKTQTVVHSRNVICAWKPILIYHKKPLQIVDRTFKDVFSFKREKELHDWQQAEGDAKYLIDFFSDIGDMVLDPFAGGGTIPKCCKDNKRKCIAIDIDKDAVDTTKGRMVTDETESSKK